MLTCQFTNRRPASTRTSRCGVVVGRRHTVRVLLSSHGRASCVSTACQFLRPRMRWGLARPEWTRYTSSSREAKATTLDEENSNAVHHHILARSTRWCPKATSRFTNPPLLCPYSVRYRDSYTTSNGKENSCRATSKTWIDGLVLMVIRVHDKVGAPVRISLVAQSVLSPYVTPPSVRPSRKSLIILVCMSSR